MAAEQRHSWSADDFDYHLPQELIAQHPAPLRSASRMLVLDRATGHAQPRHFPDIVDELRPGDCLVVNDSRVMAARLFGIKEGGSARIEALLVRELGDGEWLAMLRPGKRVRTGTRVRLEKDDSVWFEVLGRGEEGTFRLRFSTPETWAVLEHCGQVPLPPYIDREATASDRERYQTVYAQAPGSVAAPTAGLHFTPEILAALADKGVRRAAVTLHVGPGTFKPVSSGPIDEHIMHEEHYVLEPEQARLINETRAAGGRIVAIGTTSVRVLESCATAHGRVEPQRGATRIFIYPPYDFHIVDALLTNFHLPKSTLIMLVAALAGREPVLAAYQRAVADGFRFYSYGDCMFIR